jgi:hypothetical protein
MSPELLLNAAIRPAHRVLSLLSDRELGGAPAETLSLAIALQESRATHRAQIRGPARSYWQFEFNGGFKGVLRHTRTSLMASQLVEELNLPNDPDELWQVFPHNDLLAAGFARLLIYSDNGPLPRTQEEGWAYYIRNWRPGKPHPESWGECWATAVETVGTEQPEPSTALVQVTQHLTDALELLRGLA